jgi:hypothetical protein
MRQHTAEPRPVKFVQLPQQFRLVEVVIPKPKRHQPKLARRIQELVEGGG